MEVDEYNLYIIVEKCDACVDIENIGEKVILQL